MNFLNPLIEIYIDPIQKVNNEDVFPYYREILWLYSKNLNNGLKMFQHRVNIRLGKDLKTGNQKFGSIYEYHTSFDFESFSKLDTSKQKMLLTDLVYKAFSSLANQYNWNIDIIIDAYKKCKLDNYEFGYLTEFKSNRNRKSKGRIRITLNKRLVTFTSEIINSNNPVPILTELLTTEQSNFSWWRKINEFGWYDNEFFGLKLGKGLLWLTSNFSGKQREIFNPKTKKINELKDIVEELRKNNCA